MPSDRASDWRLRAAELERPILRQHGTQLLVLGIVGVLLPKSPDSPHQLVLIHFEHVGDHTRGLFEAEASVSASASHPLQDDAVFGVHGKSLGRACLLSGYDDGLTGNRLATSPSGDAYAREEPPLGAIAKPQDEERVLDSHTG